MKLIVIILITFVVLVIASLIKFFCKNKPDWAHVATIIAGLATAIALPWAAYTFYEGARIQRELSNEGARLQREISASSIYQEHMKLSVEHPELANAEIAPQPPKEGSSLNKDKDKNAYDQYIKDKASYERYQWYVGHAMFSFETILDVLPDDVGWKETAQGFIRTHEIYIGSDKFPCERYTQRIRLLVNETLKREVERCSART